jgi:hypothetical protein
MGASNIGDGVGGGDDGGEGNGGESGRGGGGGGGGPLRVVVCAGQGAISLRYREALDLEAGARFVSLDSLLGSMAPNVIDLRGHKRPRASDGATDVQAVLAALHAAQRASAADAPGCKTGASAGHSPAGACLPSMMLRPPLLTLQLSGPGGPAFGDAHTAELVDGLTGAAAGAVLASLGQVWVHHTGLSDASCGSLALLIGRSSSLREIHLSDCDPGISLDGVEQLASAAKAAGYGSTAGRPHRLYINARHLALSPESAALQRSYMQSITLRLGGPQSANGGGGGRVPGGARGRGNGRGSPGSRGSPSGRGISGPSTPSPFKQAYHGSRDIFDGVGGRGAGGRGGRSAMAQAAARLAGRDKGFSPGGGGVGMPVPALGGGKSANGAAARRLPPTSSKGRGKGG